MHLKDIIFGPRTVIWGNSLKIDSGICKVWRAFKTTCGEKFVWGCGENYQIVFCQLLNLCFTWKHKKSLEKSLFLYISITLKVSKQTHNSHQTGRYNEKSQNIDTEISFSIWLPRSRFPFIKKQKIYSIKCFCQKAQNSSKYHIWKN